ncbi:MAG TPA: hypothetical protein VD886_19040 [Herpetosiphonaceae bacterium]|nr:hypothetical protein [Herpetosiphonaceae bacterium]
MSTGASGDIVSVPIAAIVILPVAAGAAAAVAAAAVVTAIAGVGAVAVRETGKAVIACGRELMTMAAENMATHRLLFEAASQHEARLAAAELQADEQRAGSVADYVARQRRHMADHAATLARLRESLKSPPPAVTIDWTAIHAAQERVAGASSAPAKAERASPRDWGLRIDAALRWAGLIENGFSMLDSGPNKGLFNLTGVRELLQD